MRSYIKKRRGLILTGVALLAFIHIYFGYLVNTRVYTEDLLYLDCILAVVLAVFIRVDYKRYVSEQTLWAEQEEELEKVRKKNEQLSREIREQSEYIAKWSHEIKLPLSALGLMNGRNPDKVLQDSIQDCLERIRQQLNVMLMSGKLKTLENDVVFLKTELAEVVNEAVKGQSWLLIRERFQIETSLHDIWVYSDKRWLAYILDQLIANAVKYRKGESSSLRFWAERISPEETKLYVEDAGIGIRKEDLPYIFDRGYIGGNLRNGDYRSTGMGLYFAREAAARLGIEMAVESREGEWTRFILYFRNNAEFFLLDEDSSVRADTLQEC